MPSYLVSAKESFVPTEMYTPPVQTLGEMLRIKQGQYDQSYNQVNSGRNAIYDAEVLSADGNAKKQQYINQAQKTLQQLSQADLSLPENVKLADQVFKPFWEDQNLTHEIGLIRGNNKQQAFGEQDRNSTNKEIRDSYNPFSIQDLNNQKEEIADSTAAERKTMQTRSYVKKVDYMKEMDAALEKIGGQKGSLREDVNGGYKFTNQYGKESVLALNDFFMSRLSSDARANMQVMGRLEGHNIYNRALTITGGDKNAAKNMLAENIMAQRSSTINDELVPELTKSVNSLESNIKTMLLATTNGGSDLSQQQVDYINQQTFLLKQQQNKISSLNKEYKELTDKKAPDYQKNVDIYKAGADDFYTQNAVTKYANSWARSTAAVLSSQKIEEDKTSISLQQMNLAAAKENEHTKEFYDALSLKEKLGTAKLNAQNKKEAGQVGGGSLSGTYIGQSTYGVQDLGNYGQYATIGTQLRSKVIDPTIGLVQKAMNDNLQLPSTFFTKLLDGMHSGKDAEAFFTNTQATQNDPDYISWKKAYDDNKLGTEKGKAYKWTYQNVFEVLQKSLMNWSTSDEGMLKISNNGTEELDQLIKNTDDYKASKEDQAILTKEVFNKNPNYAPFLTNKDGFQRLMTDEELIGDSTVDMHLSDDIRGKLIPVKIKDIVNNNSSIKMSYNMLHPHKSITINGQVFEPGDFSGTNILGVIQDKGWEGIKKLKSDDLEKLKDLRGQFVNDFNKISPTLQTTKGSKNDAFSFGVTQYAATDKKNTEETAEVAVKSLLGPENMRNMYSNFLGVTSSDLKPNSSFVKLLNNVSNYLAPGNEDVAVNANSYDQAAGGQSFKIILKTEDLYKALGTSTDKATADEKKAIELFQSPSFRIKPPESVQQPGGIITGISPLDSQVRRKGYETSDYLDKIGMGGFKLEKQATGGFALKMWTYIPNPKTGQLEKTPYDKTIVPETFDDTVVIPDLMNICYSALKNQFNKNKSYIKANPPVPKGTGTSVQSMIASLKQKGLDININ